MIFYGYMKTKAYKFNFFSIKQFYWIPYSFQLINTVGTQSPSNLQENCLIHLFCYKVPLTIHLTGNEWASDDKNMFSEEEKSQAQLSLSVKIDLSSAKWLKKSSCEKEEKKSGVEMENVIFDSPFCCHWKENRFRMIKRPKYTT